MRKPTTNRKVDAQRPQTTAECRSQGGNGMGGEEI
jgi:hypothetical protein